MGERDVEVLCGGVVGEDGSCCVDPGEADGGGQFATVACVVEVHEVVPVLEGQPFVCGEEIEGAEGGGAADDGLVAAELEHGDDVGGGEVEERGLCLESRDDGFGGAGDEFLMLLAGVWLR